MLAGRSASRSRTVTNATSLLWFLSACKRRRRSIYFFLSTIGTTVDLIDHDRSYYNITVRHSTTMKSNCPSSLKKKKRIQRNGRDHKENSFHLAHQNIQKIQPIEILLASSLVQYIQKMFFDFFKQASEACRAVDLLLKKPSPPR